MIEMIAAVIGPRVMTRFATPERNGRREEERDAVVRDIVVLVSYLIDMLSLLGGLRETGEINALFFDTLII